MEATLIYAIGPDKKENYTYVRYMLDLIVGTEVTEGRVCFALMNKRSSSNLFCITQEVMLQKFIKCHCCFSVFSHANDSDRNVPVSQFTTLVETEIAIKKLQINCQ